MNEVADRESLSTVGSGLEETGNINLNLLKECAKKAMKKLFNLRSSEEFTIMN